MTQKLFFIVGFILALGIVGVSYAWLKFNPGLQTEVKIGQVQINYQNLGRLQEEVDKGHQPWRLDPVLMVQNEAILYGFTAEDTQTLNVPSYNEATLGTTTTELQAYIVHEGKTYLVIVGQIVPGPGKIWTILEVQKK